MTSILKSFFLLTLFSSTLHAQTIKSISIHGALKKPNGKDFELEFYSSTDGTANKSNIVAVTLSMNNTKGEYLVFDQTGTSTNWEVNQASNPTSNSWKDLCHSIKENDNACSNDCEVTYYLRHVGTTTGTETNTIKIAISSDKQNGACTYSSTGVINIEATVNKVSSTGIYTWSEPQSGTDSSYKIAGNWTPTRTTKKTDDVLVVNLATNRTRRNTTIDISNLTETIGQFKIFPHNNVSFRCTANTVWTVGNSTSLTGTDYTANDSSYIRKTGTGKLEIIVPTNNALDIDGSITTVAGDLLFSGAGSHNISGNIKTVGGLLNFTPSSGTNTLFLDGKKQILSGNSLVSGNPTLYIDTNFNVTVGTTATSPVDTLTLQRTLPIYSVLTLRAGTRILSNNPASNTEAAWHSWEPFLQLKAPQFNQAIKRGQLNVMPATSEIVGGSQFEIYGTNVRAFRMVGLPFVNGVNLSQFADDIDLTGVVSNATNKDSFTTTCDVCKTSAFNWNEGTGAWNGYSSGATANVLPKGKGTLVFFRGRKTNGLGDTSASANEGIIDFKGKLQVGNYTHTLSKSGTAGSSLDGFNLVANPYPSNITFDEVYGKHKSQMKPRFRTYDARRKTYNIWDSTVQNSPGKSGARKFANSTNQQAKIIAAGAAFFVEAQANNETIAFTESMKTPFAEAKTAHHGVQELTETACNQILVNLSYRSDTLFDSDNVNIMFDIQDERVTHSATETDITEFYAGYLGIGTLSPEGTWLTIDRRPRLALPSETYTIPIKTVYPKDALKDLILDFDFCTSNQSNYKVQLIDKVKNTSTDVTDLVQYPYEINSTDDRRENRFDLLFTGIDQQNAVENQHQSHFVAFPNPSENGVMYVTNTQGHTITDIELINQMGQIVKKFPQHNPKTLIELNHDNLPSGLYFLRIVSPNFTQTQAVSLK